jgi:hypothetical protein
MPFSRLLKNFSHPTPARSGPTDAESNTSDDSNVRQRGRQANESMATIRRPLKVKRLSSTDDSSPSQPTLTPPFTFKAKDPTTEGGTDEMSPPVPAIPSVLFTNAAVVPLPEMVPNICPVPDKLADAWEAVKGDPKITNMSRDLDTVGVSSFPRLFGGELDLGIQMTQLIQYKITPSRPFLSFQQQSQLLHNLTLARS